MVYESSYESGRRPFLPDTTRGSWSNPNDFLYAGLSMAFRLDAFSMSWFLFIETGVLAFIPFYLISMVLYIVPFIVLQSFMGQFSSSGFISAFRLSPLFKGIGYVTLVLNISVLAYSSVFAMVPLVYMFASMQPILPWSCEGFKNWAYNLTAEEENNLCNLNLPNVTEEMTSSNDTNDYIIFVDHHIPSVLYFKTLFNDINLFTKEDVEFSMSWQLILCALLVWAIVTLVFYKLFNTEKFGQLIRYTVWTVIGLLILFVIRFSFLPGARHAYHRAFIPQWRDVPKGLFSIPVYGLSSFGPGWGLFITLSSFNKFNTNIINYSWLIGLGQLLLSLSLNMLAHLTENYFGELTDYNYFNKIQEIWTLYLSSGSVMANMPWANLWSILFFFMLFLSSMLLIIMQLYSILTSIFDEFVFLRRRKLEVTMGLIGFVAAFSLYFTSNDGLIYLTALAADTYITQTAINLLLLLTVLWIYGRVRFQRDIEFMINERFSTWKINMLRFVAPFGMILVLMFALFLSHLEHGVSGVIIAVYAIIFIVIPWLCIPGYAVYLMRQSVGSIKMRFQRCCRPTDWYPIETEQRQRYEVAVGNMDITHQLNEISNEVL